MKILRITEIVKKFSIGEKGRSHPLLLTLTRKTVVSTHELLAQLPLGAGGDLKNQLQRASASVALNLAEASGRHGKDRRRFLDFAKGSARETREGLALLADLGCLDAAQVRALDRQWDRVCAVLYRVMRG
ncbi:four helix bundle protein [Myxococcota bacterium]|nr:four helix bundle protein [Myxococcota bacterium]